MHIGLVTLDVPGHLNPFCTLGEELRRRGHRVTVIGSPRIRKYPERNGLEHIPIGAEFDEIGARDWQQLGELSGIAAVRQTGRVLGREARVHLRELPPIIAKQGIDALLVDQISPGAAVVAERLKMPLVIACNALVSHYDPDLPPPPIPWRYRPDFTGRMRNRLATFAFGPFYTWLSGGWLGGISPVKLVYEQQHGLAQIAQQPAFFDFPRHRLPDHFHYTAPWHRLERDDQTVEFPWDKLDGRPLIYASMGTLQNQLLGVLQMILDAAEKLDVQLVLSLGRRDAQLNLRVPPGSIVTPFAPQLRLLQQAVAAVTHAGLNTVLECLALGVPMVCIPVTNDQPGVARRVEYLNLGEMIALRHVTVDRIRGALRLIIAENRFRDESNRRRDELAQLNGPALAADIALQAFTTKQRVTAANLQRL